MIQVRKATAADGDACVEILEHLADYFTPDTHGAARHSISEHSGWVAVDNDLVVGFVIAEMRYAEAAEITFAAVTPRRRRSGIGTQMLEHVLADLASVGVSVVEVKTLDASAGYEPYVATRVFWETRGFPQIDCIDPLPGWLPGNPSAIYVAGIRPTSLPAAGSK